MMGCDVLCVTPGRLKQILKSKWVYYNNNILKFKISLDKLKFFVLDEADRLLEENFLEIIQECLAISGFPDVNFFKKTLSNLF